MGFHDQNLNRIIYRGKLVILIMDMEKIDENRRVKKDFD